MENQDIAAEWTRRAMQKGLYAVMSRRWTLNQCQEVHQQHVQIVLKCLSPIAGKRIIDVGCGIGRISTTLARHGASVVGIDSCEAMLHKAQGLAAHSNVTYMCAEASDLPVDTASMDAALAVMVLQHILDDIQFTLALHEITRVVKPGGRILIIDGTAAAQFQPLNSPITLVRTMSDFSAILAACRAIGCEHIDSAGDDYSVMIWERNEA